MDNPAELGSVEDLPIEKWFQIALELPYDQLPKFCRQNRMFADVCRDPDFWRYKLQRDFPEISIKGLDRKQLKARYQLALADVIDDDAEEVEAGSETDLNLISLLVEKDKLMKQQAEARTKARAKAAKIFKEDNITKKDTAVRSAILKVTSVDVEQYRAQIVEIEKQIKAIEKEYDVKILKLTEHADELRRLGEAEIPVYSRHEYVTVTVPTSYLTKFPQTPDEDQMHYAFVEELTDAYEDFTYDPIKLWAWMKKNGWLLPDGVPMDGMLVGIRFEGQPGAVPFDLLHIYHYRGHLHFTASGNYREYDPDNLDVEYLPRQLEKLPLDEIERRYNLPFKIMEPIEDV